jgi:hypothetical protein
VKSGREERTNWRCHAAAAPSRVTIWARQENERFASSEKSVGHRYGSNGGRKFGSRSPRTDARQRGFNSLLFAASCLSNLFTLSGKRYTVRKDQSRGDHFSSSGVSRQLDLYPPFGQRIIPDFAAAASSMPT